MIIPSLMQIPIVELKYDCCNFSVAVANKELGSIDGDIFDNVPDEAPVHLWVTKLVLNVVGTAVHPFHGEIANRGKCHIRKC